MNNIRSYALVTGACWGFTITDGALRMLVVLHFYKLGYDSISIAFLFLFYEFFGIVTNLFGGWIAARSGVKVTLYGGLVLQIFALPMLALLNPHWSEVVSVGYVMAAQALSGIPACKHIGSGDASIAEVAHHRRKIGAGERE